MKIRNTTWTYVLPLLAFVIFSFSTACSKKRETPVSSAGADAQGSTAAPSYFKIINSRELMNFLSAAVNTPLNDATLLQEFKNLYPTLPQNGDSSYLGTTSRMYQNFMYRACARAMTNEQNLSESNRSVYKYADLNTPPNSFTTNDAENRFRAYIKHVARRFYQKAIPDDEYRVLVAFYEAQRSQVSQDAAGARDLAQQVCAIVGASFRSIARM